jgi:hypothetical protein
LICPHCPVLDTLPAFAVHRKGAKHQAALTRRNEQRIQRQEQYPAPRQEEPSQRSQHPRRRLQAHPNVKPQEHLKKRNSLSNTDQTSPSRTEPLQEEARNTPKRRKVEVEEKEYTQHNTYSNQQLSAAERSYFASLRERGWIRYNILDLQH